MTMQTPKTTATARIARHWIIAALAGAALLILISVASVVIYAGLYNIAADTPHTQSAYWLLKKVRERSVTVRAADIAIPADLTDKRRIASGAAQYAEMCSECHLAPGMKRTEISQGLYPRAPQLWRGTSLTPAEEFWIVKHGIKLTGMPAWGATHDDRLLWDVVAFLRKLPDLSPEEYQTVIKSAPKSHGEMMQEMETEDGHDHGHP